MNKLQLTEELAVRLGITHSESERFVNTFIGLIYEKTAADEKLNISGFAQFSRSHRASRIGVNPRNPSQKITIPELYTPKIQSRRSLQGCRSY